MAQKITTIEELKSLLQAGNALTYTHEGQLRPTYIYWHDGNIVRWWTGDSRAFIYSSILTMPDVVRLIIDGQYEIVSVAQNVDKQPEHFGIKDLTIPVLAEKVESYCEIFVNAEFPLDLNIYYEFSVMKNGDWRLTTCDGDCRNYDHTHYDSVFKMWLDLLEVIACPNATITYRETNFAEQDKQVVENTPFQDELESAWNEVYDAMTNSLSLSTKNSHSFVGVVDAQPSNPSKGEEES